MTEFLTATNIDILKLQNLGTKIDHNEIIFPTSQTLDYFRKLRDSVEFLILESKKYVDIINKNKPTFWLDLKIDTYVQTSIREAIYSKLDGCPKSYKLNIEISKLDSEVQRSLSKNLVQIHSYILLEIQIIRLMAILHIEKQATTKLLSSLDVELKPDSLQQFSIANLIFGHLCAIKQYNEVFIDVYNAIWTEIIESFYYRDSLTSSDFIRNEKNIKILESINERLNEKTIEINNKFEFIRKVNDEINFSKLRANYIYFIKKDKLIVNGNLRFKLIINFKSPNTIAKNLIIHKSTSEPLYKQSLHIIKNNLTNNHNINKLANYINDINSWLEIYRFIKMIEHSVYWKPAGYYSCSFQILNDTEKDNELNSKINLPFYYKLLLKFGNIKITEKTNKIKQFFSSSNFMLECSKNFTNDKVLAEFNNIKIFEKINDVIKIDPILKKIDNVSTNYSDYKMLYLKMWVIAHSLNILLSVGMILN